MIDLGGSGPFAVLALACLASCAASPPLARPVRSADPGNGDEEALRANPPPPEPSLRFKVPEPYVATLPNGMRLVVFERHALRVVAAQLVVRGGTAGLSDESPAAVHLMVNTLMRGTRRKSESQLYQAMNENVIEVYPHANDTWLGFTLRAPSARFDQALTILGAIALEPTFDPRAIEVVRSRLIGNESTNADQPSVAGQRNLFTKLYGSDHPYTVALAPKAHDLENVTRDDVANTWREMMDPAQSTLVIAGDVNPLVVRQSIATLFGSWELKTAPSPASVVLPEPAATSGRIVAVDRPGARQATILCGWRLPDDSTDQSAAGALVRELVEQAETRRIGAPAGGEPGATWKARQHFPAATLWWEKTVGPDQTGSVLKEVDDLIGELRDHGPSADDLKMARARVTRAWPLWFETVEQIADAFGDLVGSNLPLDWNEKFLASAAGLPWEQVRGALPSQGKMYFVVVGDLTKVLDQLLSVGWGPIEVHDADGRLIRTVLR